MVASEQVAREETKVPEWTFILPSAGLLAAARVGVAPNELNPPAPEAEKIMVEFRSLPPWADLADQVRRIDAGTFRGYRDRPWLPDRWVATQRGNTSYGLPGPRPAAGERPQVRPASF